MLLEAINNKVAEFKKQEEEREAQLKAEIEDSWKEAIENSSYVNGELTGNINLRRDDHLLPFKAAMKVAEDEGFVLFINEYCDLTNVEIASFYIKGNQIEIWGTVCKG